MRSRAVNIDNTIEFLKGRVYLGAYDYAPKDSDDLVFFTVEDAIFYNSFHLDFGPLNIGHLYRFAVIFHEILNDQENADKSVVFYSSTSSRQRANAACLLCCYMVLVQGWTPHQVLQPLAQVDPPFMPFRDAGYSNADFEISIQDVIYGVWRAKERGLIDLHSFNLETYERYEHVENGDFNVLTPDFIAFASPQEEEFTKYGGQGPSQLSVPSARQGLRLNQPFRSVLNFFSQNNVQLVVRLNSHLYDKKHFEDINIQHLDLIFEDGTCPDLSFVKYFIGAAETIIRRGGKIAVHCKAGLGRTGCLIGAHLIYTHGFTANECIGFLRFIRPGMVVGPQQHWLYLHQNDFREWKYTMALSLESSDRLGGLYPLVSIHDYRLQKRKLRDMKKTQLDSDSPGEQPIQHDLVSTPTTMTKIRKGVSTKSSDPTGYKLSAVPQHSPGQPRKGQNGSRNIESIKKSKDDSHDFMAIDNNSDNDDEVMKDGDSRGISTVPQNSHANGKSERMIQQHTGNEAVLKQLLPKSGRRSASGKRNASFVGGVRKVSGTKKI